eukprot:TRINITY_DN9179_c0_g1_i4.p3 TRINITY_DN9179_c0_g1~~TRINITY_DN9179_c0_g1_i4.p3  ORF type:complete len:204 (+),score=41.40 TRINITY_DN9179_c0_g1_i4:24-635(+)
MDKFDNFFAKGLDKLQKVVEEYPQKQSPGSSSHQVLSEGGVLKAWQQFNLAPRKAVLIETLNSLQSGQGDFDVAPLLEVAEHLSNLPDPVLHLERAQAIELEIKELKDKNSKLQKQAEHNQLDNAEVNKLIEQSKRLETERAEFKTQMEAKDQKMHSQRMTQVVARTSHLASFLTNVAQFIAVHIKLLCNLRAAVFNFTLQLT